MFFVSESSRARLARGLPVLVGVLTFAFVWVGRAPPGPWGLDFDYLWTAGRAVCHGGDPYVSINNAIHQGTLRWPFYYPGAAAVLMVPFGALPHQLAVSLFTALGAALLVWSVRGWRRWIILSAPALEALLLGQWSPWLTAAAGLPWLGFVWAAKPSVGLALFAGWPSRRALYGGLLVTVLSLILLPHWPVEWLNTVRNAAHYKAPVQRAGGFLLLLAWLQWRRPEARLLGTLALVPHTTSVYELLPVLLVPKTGRSFAVLLALSYVATAIVYVRFPFGGSVSGTLEARWPYFLVFVWLPALFMVLRGSPSNGATDQSAAETVPSTPVPGTSS
jgi:hypothetical protein